MRLLEPNTTLKSYVWPVCKIVISVAMIIVLIYRNKIFNATSRFWQIFITIVAFVLLIILIVCVYISLAEIVYTKENREKFLLMQRESSECECVEKPIEEILSLVRQADIIEVIIKTNDGFITIGSSSNCKNSSSKFFDKKYYIEDAEFERVEDFYDVLKSFSQNGKISVYSIDGIRIDTATG